MLPAPFDGLFQAKINYSTLGASNQFLYRTSKSRQTNREKDNDSPNKITKAHNSTFTRVILTLKKHKSTASGPAFCQVSGGAFLKSVIKSAIFSGFGQKVRAHILITIVSKYASLHVKVRHYRCNLIALQKRCSKSGSVYADAPWCPVFILSKAPASQ